MFTLATNQHRRLLDQTDQANQNISDTVELILTELQKPSRRARRQQLQKLTTYLNRINHQLAAQRQSQQMIRANLTPPTCTARPQNFITAANLHTLEKEAQDHATRHQPTITTSRRRINPPDHAAPIIRHPPRIIGQT